MTTSCEFADIAVRKRQNILIKHINKSETKSEIPKLNEDWDEISPIANMQVRMRELPNDRTDFARK